MSVWMIESLKEAIDDLYVESLQHLHMSQKGFADHLWTMVMNASVGSSELWLACDGEKVIGFLLSAYTNEFDNEPTFVIRQAWVAREIRRSPLVKQMLKHIIENAKKNFAKHVLIVSSRSTKAYLRWLGKGWKPITTILKGDL